MSHCLGNGWAQAMSSYSQVLVEKGLVSLEDIDSAERMREEQGLRLDQALIQNGAITEQVFLSLIHI